MSLVLHIGFPKTGTTSLQTCLRDHGDRLAARGVLYPLANGDFKQRSLKLLVSTGWQPGDDQDATLRATREMMVQFTQARPDGHIILSCEELANAFISDYSAASLGRLRAFLAPWADDLRLVAYLRSPQDYYLPIMQESLKRSVDIVPPGAFRTDYAAIIGRFEDALGASAVVRVFDRARLHRGDLVEDFFHQIRDLVDVDTAALDRPNSNESLPAEVLFLLDLLQHSSVFPGAPGEVSKAHAERFWRDLRDIAGQVGAGRKPILFESAAREIGAGNRDDCTALTRRYGIVFPDHASVPDDRAAGQREILSPIEAITPVDRHLAFRILGMWSYQASQSLQDGKAREAAARTDLRALHAALSDAERRLAETQRGLAGAQDRLAATENRLTEARTRLRALETSRWWRIAAPLRRVKRLLRRF